MLKQLSRAKSYQSRIANSPPLQSATNQNEQAYINPIVKYTYDCLPKIYGSNSKRKKKYNYILKNRNQFLTSNNSNDIKQTPKHHCWNTKATEVQTNNNRGISSMSYDKKNSYQKQHRQNNNNSQEHRQTAIKKYRPKITQISSEVNLKQSKVRDITPTPKASKNLNMQALHALSKPRDKCNNQYCSCKSFYEQYQDEVNKKLKQKLRNQSSHKRNGSNLKLPKIKNKLQTQIYLDDQQSRHKINSNSRINSLPSQFYQHQQKCCMCNHGSSLQKNTNKGLLGMIKKKQLQKSKTKQLKQSKQLKQNQFQQNLNSNVTEDHATQANFTTPKKPVFKVDCEVNTDFQDQKMLQSGFKYLQNKKKQENQHLSQLKQKYKNNKNQFNSKSPNNQKQIQNKTNNQKQKKQSENKLTGNKRPKKQKPSQQTQQFDLNASISSVMSQNFLLQNLAKALGANQQLDKKTIFSVLKKKQLQSQNEENGKKQKAITQRQNNRQKGKVQLVNQNNLFTIPQQQQYIDYLKNYKPIMKDFKIKDLLKSQNFRILKCKDTLYFGQVASDQNKHGKALIITPKQIFQGVYQNGVRMSGCQRNIDGAYIGQFLNGKRHGQGKFQWNNGQVFQGQWKLGTKNGFGIWKSPKGDYYEGNWLLNRQHGKGIYKHKNSTYEGQFKNFLKNGQGKQKFINGDQYIGQYKDGKPHGKGKYRWKNGSLYQGQFFKGLRQGYGVWKQGSIVYEGQFKKDFKHGKGLEYYKNGDSFQGIFEQGIKKNGIYKQILTGKSIQIKDTEQFKKEVESKLNQSNVNLENLSVLKQLNNQIENQNDDKNVVQSKIQ